MKVFLVDDERHVRDELRGSLQNVPGIEIAGEASNGMEAWDLLRKLDVDLLFLDIQMPGMSGFELLSRLGNDAPKIIFTTAYDSYALQAFEFGAADYLLKPVSQERLERALQRISLGPDAGGAPDDTGAGGRHLNPQDKILLSDGEKLLYVPLSAVVGAESLGAHSVIWLESGTAVVRRSLAVLESKLPGDLFFRANRSQIINLGQIASVASWFSGSLKVTLSGGRSVELSRRQSKLFREKTAL